MNSHCLILLICALAVGFTSSTIQAQGLRQQPVEPAKPDEVKEFLLSGNANKIYRALIVKDAPQPPSSMKPLWLFLTETEEPTFRVRDRTVIGYHMVDVRPLVRQTLAGYGVASHDLIDQGFDSDDTRKRVEACHVAGLFTDGGNHIYRRLVTASEDDHGHVRVAAIRALPAYGEEAIDPLFRRLKRCSDWQREGSFSFEEISAISGALVALSEHAEVTLTRLVPYLDRRTAPDVVISTLAAAAKQLSYANEPLTAELVLPTFEKLKSQGIAASDADYLRERYESRKKTQGGTGQPATSPESKSEGSDKPQPEAEGRFR